MKIENKPSAFIVNDIINSFPSDRELHIGFLGYHDVMLTDQQWNSIGDVGLLENRPNSTKLKEIHSRPDVNIVPTIKSWMGMYKPTVTYDVFDFTKYEGEEIEIDFNYPIDSFYHNRYDIIVDIGTLEHVFNFAQALSNVLQMTKEGGVILNHGPLCQPNHGFYGYNPTLFADFYIDNGCEIIDIALQTIIGPGNIAGVSGIPLFDRFNLMQIYQSNPQLNGREFNLLVLTKKNQTVENIVYPIQRKYRSKDQWM